LFVIPAKLVLDLIGERVSRLVPRIKYGASSAELVPVKTGSRERYKERWIPVFTGNPGFPFPAFARTSFTGMTKYDDYGIYEQTLNRVPGPGSFQDQWPPLKS